MILALVSGGLDSTTMLWRLLSEGTEEVHVHHVSLRDGRNRWRCEDAAVTNIVAWLRGNVRDVALTVEAAQSRGLDDVRVKELAAAWCRNSGLRPDAMAWGTNAHNAVSPRSTEHRAKGDAAWREGWAPDDPPPIVRPVMEMTRPAMYAALPPALREMAWSCRRPRFGSEQVAPCGVCHACREYADHGITHPTMRGLTAWL